MPENLFFLSGTEFGVIWSVTGVASHEGLYFAIVTVGDVQRKTTWAYETIEEARQAGIYLFADMVEEIIHA